MTSNNNNNNDNSNNNKMGKQGHASAGTVLTDVMTDMQESHVAMVGPVYVEVGRSPLPPRSTPPRPLDIPLRAPSTPSLPPL